MSEPTIIEMPADSRTVPVASIEARSFGRVPFNLIALAALSIPFQLLTLLGLNVFLAIDRIDLLNLLDVAMPALLLINAIIVLVILGAGLRALVSFNTSAVILLALMMVVV